MVIRNFARRLCKSLAVLPAALLGLYLAGSPAPAQAGIADTAWTAARMSRRGAASRRVCRVSRSGARRCVMRRGKTPAAAKARRTPRVIYRPGYPPVYRPAYAPPAYRPAYSPPAYRPAAPAYRPAAPAYRPPVAAAPPPRVFGAPTGTGQRFYRVPAPGRPAAARPVAPPQR